MLKNFSSLKAIISGLQSNPVYRLKKAWGHLPRDKMETFQVGGLFISWLNISKMVPHTGNLLLGFSRYTTNC